MSELTVKPEELVAALGTFMLNRSDFFPEWQWNTPQWKNGARTNAPPVNR